MNEDVGKKASGNKRSTSSSFQKIIKKLVQFLNGIWLKIKGNLELTTAIIGIASFVFGAITFKLTKDKEFKVSYHQHEIDLVDEFLRTTAEITIASKSPFDSIKSRFHTLVNDFDKLNYGVFTLVEQDKYGCLKEAIDRFRQRVEVYMNTSSIEIENPDVISDNILNNNLLDNDTSNMDSIIFFKDFDYLNILQGCISIYSRKILNKKYKINASDINAINKAFQPNDMQNGTQVIVVSGDNNSKDSVKIVDTVFNCNKCPAKYNIGPIMFSIRVDTTIYVPTKDEVDILNKMDSIHTSQDSTKSEIKLK